MRSLVNLKVVYLEIGIGFGNQIHERIEIAVNIASIIIEGRLLFWEFLESLGVYFSTLVENSSTYNFFIKFQLFSHLILERLEFCCKSIKIYRDCDSYSHS